MTPLQKFLSRLPLRAWSHLSIQNRISISVVHIMTVILAFITLSGLGFIFVLVSTHHQTELKVTSRLIAVELRDHTRDLIGILGERSPDGDPGDLDALAQGLEEIAQRMVNANQQVSIVIAPPWQDRQKEPFPPGQLASRDEVLIGLPALNFNRMWVDVTLDRWEVWKVILVLGLIFVVGTMCLLLLTLYMSLRASRAVTLPLQQLRNAALDISAGGSTEQLEPILKRHDELGVLARAFNELVIAEREVQRNLETTVELRTFDANQQRLRLETVLASIDDVIYAASMDGQQTLYVSPALNRLLKRPAEARLSLSDLRACIHPDDREALARTQAETAIKGAASVRYRIRVNDELLWLNERITLAPGQNIEVESGELIADGIISDVTVEMLAEMARREAEHMLRLKDRALEASTNGIIIADMLQVGEPVVYVNPAFTEITGYGEDEILGHTCSMLRGEDTGIAETRELREAIEAGQSCRVVLKNYRKNGTVFWNELSVAPVFDTRTNTLTHYVGVQHDVTQQRESEQALFEWLLRLDTIFTLSPDGFVSFDSEGRVDYANPAFERLLGITTGEIIGMGIEGFDARVRKQCDDRHPYPSTASQATGDASTATQTLFLSRPATRVLQRNVRNCDGQNTSRVVYYRDITHEIEVNRMKSDFLSTAAHELRTPMASVMGFSELLLTRDYPVDRQRELLSTINRQSKRLTQLLNELLDLARIEARRGEDFERKDVPVRSIVDDTLAALMMPGDSRVVQFHPCDEPVMIVADAAKIQQALTNILSNAYKYSPNGGDIHLTMIHDASAERIGLCVEDSGLGMTPEQTAKAFERFFRADASCNIPGTGLGLALVREIITLHGGTVDLESEYGKGTRITLWIPIATSPLATAADAAAHAAGITTPLNAEEA